MRTFLVAAFVLIFIQIGVSQQAGQSGKQQSTKTESAEPASIPKPDDKSSADWWLVRFTAALFAAALLQFGAMWVHAHNLHRTLEETRKIADAAATLARTNAVQLRAQLIVKIHYPIQGLALGKSPRIGFDIVNTGLTPAYDCSYETWVAVLTHPFTDFPLNADYFKTSNKSTIYPNHVPVGGAIDLGHDLTQHQMDGIQQNLKRLCFRVHLEYRDAFSAQRFANFGYSANDHAIEPLPKHNDSN